MSNTIELKPASITDFNTVDKEALLSHREKMLQFSENNGIDIPIGKTKDSQNAKLHLGCDDIYQHAIIVGSPGTGKSVLLNTIVTNLLLGFSDDIIQLHLIDTEDSTFRDYANAELSNVNYYHANKEDDTLYIVLNELEQEAQERTSQLRLNGFVNVREYNQKIDLSTNEKIMPRIIVIIDNLEGMFREDDVAFNNTCNHMLENLLRIGRSVGIHFIAASQLLSDQLSRLAYSLFATTIVFRSPLHFLESFLNNIEISKSYLSRMECGTCVIIRNSNEYEVVNVSYFPFEEQKTILRQIEALNIKTNPIMDGKEALRLLRSLNMFFELNWIFSEREKKKLAIVKQLDLAYQGIVSIPDTINVLQNLDTLILSGNSIEVLPDSIYHLVNLRDLRLNNNAISEISRDISQIIQLRYLDMSSNHIHSIPETIGLLVNLETFDLSNNIVEKLPDSFTKLQKLKKLWLNNNGLIELPKDIGFLWRLENFQIHGNELLGLPDSFRELTHLQCLDISKNQLSCMPDYITHFSELIYLYANDNHMVTIPEQIGRLVNLKRLRLFNNRLNGIPESIGELELLEEIDLSNNNLINLPATLGMLTNLRRMSVYNNNLSTIPETIGNLTKLMVINLRKNLLQTLPESLQRLFSLFWIDISENQFITVPEFIGQLPHIKYIGISCLNINFIPVSFINTDLPFIDDSLEIMEGQKEGIYIKGLNIAEQDISVFIDNNRLLIKSYYDEYKVYINEAKVIFLGDGNVGKTYSIRRLLNDGSIENSENEDYYQTSMTPGIRIEELPVIDDVDGQILLHLWDFGGQEIMHSMHKCFLTSDTCYVIVVSTRNDRDQMGQARYWLRTVHTIAEKSPVLLFVNRWARMSDRLDIEKLLKEFPDNLCSREQILFIDAKKASNEEFMELKNSLLNVVKQMPTFHRQVPQSWISIRNHLQSLSRNSHKFTINEEEYRDICQKYHLFHNIDRDEEEKLQLELLDWFNNTGVCFSYHFNKYKEPLYQYKVLNPEWLTNAIYLLIMNGNEYAQNGILASQSIKMILKYPEFGASGDLSYIKDADYKEDQLEYILEVMRKFQLSYSTEGGEFIPALCKYERPQDTISEEYDATNPNHQHVTYMLRYEYLPDSVMQNLMIRYEKYRNISIFWSRGMVINLDELKMTTIIEARDNSTELMVDIYTFGAVKPYAFLPSLREKIFSINSKLNLKCSEFIIGHGNGGFDVFSVEALLRMKQDNLITVPNQFYTYKYCIDDLLNPVFGNEIIKQTTEIMTNTAFGSLEIYSSKEIIKILNEAILNNWINGLNPETEIALTQYVVRALENLQKTYITNQTNLLEDDYNDLVRNNMSMVYTIFDQTRVGESKGGKQSGELDFEIAVRGGTKRIAIFEGQVLTSVDSTYTKFHLDKVLVNYNPNGLPYIYHVSYVKVPEEKFGLFWKKYYTYLSSKYVSPFPVKEKLREIDEDRAMIRHANTVILQADEPISVHCFAVCMK